MPAASDKGRPLARLMEELAQLRQESKAERAGQGREHILQSIQKDMAGIEAQINAAGQQHALGIQCLVSVDLDIICTEHDHPVSCWHQISPGGERDLLSSHVAHLHSAHRLSCVSLLVLRPQVCKPHHLHAQHLISSCEGPNNASQRLLLLARDFEWMALKQLEAFMTYQGWSSIASSQ